MLALKGKTIIVGVCGGIAAYKACALVSGLVKSGASVHVVMTENSTKFVAPLSFETLSCNRVIVDMFDRNFSHEVEHISLAKKADAMVIAPATANVLAKLACGIADDFLTTTALACRCKILAAPAMNTAMLENAATQGNIATLVSRGMHMIYGAGGRLACGDSGNGRMAEPDNIIAELCKLLNPNNDLAGKTVLVTAGATETNIDPVRFLTNRSSGKMGYAVACAAANRGAKVVFVKGRVSGTFYIPNDWICESIETTAQLAEAVKRHSNADLAVFAAAPCDYDVVPAPQKLKDKTLTLELKKAPDAAAWFGKNKTGKLVIFAAETENCVANAKSKLTAKNADLVVLNDVTESGAGFDADTNIVTLITSTSEERLPLMSKREVADVVLDRIIAQ